MMTWPCAWVPGVSEREGKEGGARVAFPAGLARVRGPAQLGCCLFFFFLFLFPFSFLVSFVSFYLGGQMNSNQNLKFCKNQNNQI